MQKNYKENHLKPYAIKSINSKGRIYNEKENSIRSPYQRDRDRIIHSSSFRRLKHKTQVFVNTEGDHYRTRLTHSMEVSQISRTLARSLGLNEDLCETLSLSHDLGHTPFGHAGEEVLNQCMERHGGFNHNIQTLRIVTLLENKYYKFFGLNLTIETLDGLIKHNGPVKNLNLYNAILKKNLFKNKIVFHAFPSLEAQVAAISDDIAYNNHDLEDGLRAGLFTIEKFNSIPLVSKLINKHVNNTKNYRREIIINQIVRELINVMVVDVINTTNRNLKKYNPQSIKDIYKQDHLIVDFSDKIKKVDMQIKDFLRHNMYNHKKVIINTNKGKRIIKVLFNYLSKNPKKYINDELLKKELKERVVADFIAGMTDRYAINLHKKIK
ncbi:MAG: deoxyguanosinetriphosphate triphosphohydrolase [Pelagibacterales bacterium]|jgi:dGTPase|nr:deoxyguanosinetriphosphate triphosphohydrolase [Pelagibacterales bacterium]